MSVDHQSNKCTGEGLHPSQIETLAMRQAEEGRAVFPLEGKRPLTPNGYKDASRDPEKIRAMFERAGNRATGYGIATGQVSGVVVVDVDGPRGRVEANHRGLKSGYVVKTGRPEGDGWHAYFAAPKDASIKSRTIAPGVEVKGEGAYVVGPGSRHPSGAGYQLVKGGDPSPLPRWATVHGSERSERDESQGGLGPVAIDKAGPKIPEGGRDRELTRIAGRLHDGTRTLGDLAHNLAAINAVRCDPPLPDPQVVKIARSIHGKEPCTSGRPKEVDELVVALSEFWHRTVWEGPAGKSDARFARALIREGRKIGTAIPRGLRVEKSFRQMAEILGTHRNTITNIVRRGKAAGWLGQDNANRSGAEAGAFVLIDPRQLCDTTNHRAAVVGGVTSLSRLVSEISTPHYRHRGPVGYSREHTLCVFEAKGPQSRESAAALLGWARPRDLERLHLDHLVGWGLLEKRGDLYAVPGDARERGDAVRSERYSTVQARVRRVRSVEGRYVHVVGESGTDASEVERARLDRERHERERQAYRDYRDGAMPDAHYVNVAADGHVGDLEPVGAESGDQPPLSALAVAIRSYLDARPWDAGQPYGWIGVTLWCEGWHPKLKDPPVEIRAAIEELGGARYLSDRLRAKNPALVAGAA